MDVALLLLVAAPAAAGGLVLAWGGSSDARRWIALLGVAAAAGGGVASIVETVDGALVSSRGFEADVWRAGLALAIVVVSGAAIPGRARDPFMSAVHLAGTSAAVVAVLAADLVTASAGMIATTGALAALSYARGTRDAQRAIPWYAASDLALVVGALLVAEHGLRVPPAARGAGVVLLVIAAGLRIGMLPLPWIHRVVAEESALASLALGAMRAQALAILGWVVLARDLGSGEPALEAFAIAGAIAAVLAARHAARDGSASAAAAAHAGLIVAGFGLGGTAATWGAVLLVAGTFLSATLLLLGPVRAAIPTIAAAPLGATLPGALLIATVALDRGVTDAGALAVAIPAALALAWLAHAGVRGIVRWAPDGRAHPAWSFLPLAAVAAIVLLPGWALTGVAAPAGDTLRIGRPLMPLRAALGNDLGVVFAVAALGGVFAPAPSGVFPAPPRELPERPPLPAVHTALRVGLAVGIVALGWLIVLFGVGLRRRFI